MPISVAGSGAITGTTTINGLTMPTDAIAPGMVLIASQSFTSASSVSFNNCFTSTYENYKIMFRGTCSSADVNLFMRLRALSVDNSNTNYYSQYLQASSATFTAGLVNSGLYSYWVFGTIGSGYNNNISADLFAPALGTTPPGFNSIKFEVTGTPTPFLGLCGGTMNTTTGHDGFSLIPASGTITGIAKIYGYRN